jgi:hypothetical protein
MITNTTKVIINPETDQVVFFKPWMNKNDKRKKAYSIIINSGEYIRNGRLSNFWYWQRISPSGRINPKVEYGYGNFTIAEGYEVIRKVKVTK